MSYEKAMKWGRKHPKGIRNLFLGFAAFTTPQKSQSTLARESGATSYYATSRNTINDKEERHPKTFESEDKTIDYIRETDPHETLCWRIYNNFDLLVSGW